MSESTHLSDVSRAVVAPGIAKRILWPCAQLADSISHGTATLGLLIANEVVDAHNGRIVVASGPGRRQHLYHPPTDSGGGGH